MEVKVWILHGLSQEIENILQNDKKLLSNNFFKSVAYQKKRRFMQESL